MRAGKLELGRRLASLEVLKNAAHFLTHRFFVSDRDVEEIILTEPLTIFRCLFEINFFSAVDG